MAQVIADRRDIEFVLFEQLETGALTKTEKYKDLDRKTVDMIISEARTLGIKEILPTYMEGDREGVTFENGEVRVPKCYHKAFRLYSEGEWVSPEEDPKWGGQGLPHVITQAVNEYLLGANFTLCNYGHMGHATGNMIAEYGSELQKKLFVKNLYTGKWGGTMLLTEPQAGSDLGELETTAVRNPDGTYSLTGSKIFITVGDHDLADNIIHPVLARIEGAPKGIKGISIFIVPKIWVHEDGTLGEPNDIVCTGLEEKMGLHAMSTCTMALGSKGQCRGLLLGGENQGIKIMFHMMNEARLVVGTQGFMYASAAYLHALNYAKERLQGRDLTSGNQPDAPPQVPIIRHPDVKRMLLDMKAYVDGMRSFVYYSSLCFDRKELAENEEERAYYQGMLDFMIPLVKAYCSDRGFDVCIQAIQVFGGYGYTKEYPVELLARDCKITSIYEGTNGIQSVDLLGRKLGMHNGILFKNFMQEIVLIIEKAEGIEALKKMASRLKDIVQKTGAVTEHLVSLIQKGQIEIAYAYSYPYLEVMGDLVMGWMLLWRAVTASNTNIDQKNKKERLFYESQIRTASHYIHTKLPVTLGKIDAIFETDNTVAQMDESGFGGV